MWGLVGDDYLEKCCRTPNARSYTRECQEISQKYKYIILLSHSVLIQVKTTQSLSYFLLRCFLVSTIWCFRTAILGSVFPPKSMFPSMAILSMKCTCMVPHLKTQADHSSPMCHANGNLSLRTVQRSSSPFMTCTKQNGWSSFFLYLRSLNHLNLLRVGDFPRNHLRCHQKKHLGLVHQVMWRVLEVLYKTFQGIATKFRKVFHVLLMFHWDVVEVKTWYEITEMQLQFQSANKEEKQNKTRRINVWLMYNLTYFYQQIN